MTKYDLFLLLIADIPDDYTIRINQSYTILELIAFAKLRRQDPNAPFVITINRAKKRITFHMAIT